MSLILKLRPYLCCVELHLVNLYEIWNSGHPNEPKKKLLLNFPICLLEQTTSNKKSSLAQFRIALKHLLWLVINWKV